MSSFTQSKKRTVKTKFDNRCAYCGCKLPLFIQIDHIIPRDKFTEHVVNGMVPDFLRHLTVNDVNHVDNLFPSCLYCNRYKDNDTLEQFRSKLAKINYELSIRSRLFRMAMRFRMVEVTPKPVVFYFETLKK